MVSQRCASPTVRDIGNEQVGSVNHPFVPADNGVLRRYVFKRRIDNLVKKAVVEKLKQTYQLSETDIQLCCLLKLKLPLARIAPYLKIAPDSVKKKKARLKKDLEKKLGGWGTHSSFDSWLLDL